MSFQVCEEPLNDKFGLGIDGSFHATSFQANIVFTSRLSTTRPQIIPSKMSSATDDDRALLYMTMPLDASLSEIRILHILPAEDGLPLSCILETVSLDANPSYEALSYHWGDPNICKPIIVNNENDSRSCTLEVTVSLERAMHNLRSRTTSRAMWIDAICIDQEDYDEKSQQVPLMRRIYASAWKVIVWLGVFDRDLQVALDHVRMLSSLTSSSFKSMQESLETYNFTTHKQLSVLIRNPWWHRSWIIQEMAVGKAPLFLCGTTYVSWWSFCRAADKLECMDPPMKRFLNTKAYTNIWQGPYLDFTSGVTKLRHVRDGYQKYQWLPLLWLLYTTRGCQSSDPRDVIWSLHGLLSVRIQSFITPDYEGKSLNDASQETCIATIAESGTLDILSISSNRDSMFPYAGPSWTPKFVDYSFFNSPAPLEVPVFGGPFNASRSTTSTVRSVPGLIGLKGFVVDKIKKTIEHDFIHKEREHWAKLSSSFKSKISGIAPDIRQLLNQNEPIWRLLIANIDDTGRYPASEDYGERWAIIIAPEPRNVSLNEINKRRSFIWPYHSRFSMTTVGRSLFIAESGFLVLTDCRVRKGDIVVILYGGRLPYILRDFGGMYVFMGEAYVPGIMNGEMISFRKVIPNMRFWYPEKVFWIR
jgi:hypothetical protein